MSKLSLERLEHLIARSTDVVVATDRSGTVIFYNDGAKRILGYSAEEVLGTFVGHLYPDIAEAKRVMEAIRSPEHGGAGIVETFPTTYLSKAGEHIPMAISGTLIRNEQGEEDGTIGFAKDLREIIRRDQLATLGEVAIGLSHEINNPLGVVVNQVELLERDLARLAGDRDVSVENERLDAIRREVGRIAETLDRLGEMARTETYETVNYVGPARMIDLRSTETREHQADPRLENLRVLVVDDDEGICHSLREILELDGCKITTAHDGAQALRRIESQEFDAVLSDVVMPNMDGYQLYSAVREKKPGLPVLMMTAFNYDKDHIIKRGRLAGLEGVIFKKPVDPDRLRQILVESVDRSRARKGRAG